MSLLPFSQNTTVPSASMDGGTVQAEHLFEALPSPEVKEGGNFTCVASNQVGTTMRTVEVIVQRK